MPTVNEKIIEYLQQHPEGADDDELAVALGLRQRQTANIICRQLAAEGLISRVKRPGEKIRNFSTNSVPVQRKVAPQVEPTLEPKQDWYWEGNVQAAVVRHLVNKGYSITRVADTGAREKGKDIEAKGPSGVVWVTAKGYPRETPKTRPQTQAGHWFSGALFDIICWRGENSEAELAMALPDFPPYRNLAQRVSWLKSAARFRFIWVCEDGEVEVEH